MQIHSYEKVNNDLYPTSYMVAFLGFSDQDVIDMSAWCYTTFGPSASVRGDFDAVLNRGCRWRNNIPWGEVEFVQEQDRTMFLLRWS